jgi:hypothetical protein
MRRHICIALFLLAAIVATFDFQPSTACPMCAAANESEQTDAQPRAYMYSILFMLAMPVTISTVFGVSFYRLSRQRDSAQAGAELPSDRTAE